jgi:hypothetical protein
LLAAVALLALGGGGTATAGSSDVLVEVYYLDDWDPVVDQHITFSLTIANTGESSTGSFWVDLYPDREEPPDQFEPGTQSCRIDPMGPTSSRYCEMTISYGAAGEYHWWVVVDREAEVWESNETNNIESNYLTVQTDSDDDLVGDQHDNCLFWPNPSQSVPAWPVPANDSDCDGVSNTRETYLGTDPTLQCAANSGSNNEPGADRWPYDMNDNQVANTLDVGVFVFTLNQSNPNHPGPSTNPLFNKRHDFNGNGIINTLDIGGYVFVLNKPCSPSGP